MLLLAVFCAVLSAVYSDTTSVSQCISNQGQLPINTYVKGCAVPPCGLVQLQNAEVDIIFRVPHTIRSMRTVVTAYLPLGIITLPVPYDLGANSITCNFLTNSYCPVIEGEVLQYSLRMFVESIFPVGTQATLEFRIVDESDNQPFICIRVGIRVLPPIESLSLTSTNTTST